MILNAACKCIEQDHGGVKIQVLAAGETQNVVGFGHTHRFAQLGVLAKRHLIGTNDQMLRMIFSHGLGFACCQTQGGGGGRFACKRRFVYVWRASGEGQIQLLQLHLAKA